MNIEEIIKLLENGAIERVKEAMRQAVGYLKAVNA